jgi:ankyrin repeat protein
VVVRGVDSQEETYESRGAKELQLTAQGRRPYRGGEGVKEYEDTMMLLLEAGVSPDLPTKRGRTVMHWAAASGYIRIIQLLKSWGAVSSAADVNGKYPWHFAVESGARAATALF